MEIWVAIVEGSIEWHIESDQKLTSLRVLFLIKRPLKLKATWDFFCKYVMVHLIEFPVNSAWFHKLLSAAFC